MVRRTPKADREALRPHCIYNDWELAKFGGRYIDLLWLRGTRSTFVIGFQVITMQEGEPLKPARKLYHFSDRKGPPGETWRQERARVLALIKAELGGEWERSPFNPNAWHPAGTVAKALAEYEWVRDTPYSEEGSNDAQG